MIHEMVPLAPTDQNQQSRQERASTDYFPMLETIVAKKDDIPKFHHRTQDKPEARDDLTSILQAIEMDYDSSERRDAPLLLAEEQVEVEEQRGPVLIKTHRRTRATDWSELSRTFQDSPKIRYEQHRRSLAMTEDEFMEIVWVCDELDGPGALPRHTAVWDSLCKSYGNEL